MHDEVDVAVDRDALHVERVRMRDEEQAVLLVAAARTRCSVSALMIGQSVRVAESIFENILTQSAPLAAMRATTASGVCSAAFGAGRQRMLARVRRLEDVVVEDRVADRLVDEHQRIAVDDGRRAAAVDVRMLRLRRELGDALGQVAGIEHLRHAEIEIAARLLREELLLQVRESRDRRAEWQADGVGDVHVRVGESRRQELARAIQPARARRQRRSA